MADEKKVNRKGMPSITIIVSEGPLSDIPEDLLAEVEGLPEPPRLTRRGGKPLKDDEDET